MRFSLRYFLPLFFGFLLTLLVIAVFSNEKTAELSLNGDKFTVRLADSPIERYRGLSDVTPEDLAGAAGMAFYYTEDEVRNFSMRRMLFPLDFIWVRKGIVVSIDENILPPQKGEEPVAISSDPLTADIVLEFPAGFVKKHDIFIGTSAELTVR
jgi:uncharacterized membrane protein (UPF0127 family)